MMKSFLCLFIFVSSFVFSGIGFAKDVASAKDTEATFENEIAAEKMTEKVSEDQIPLNVEKKEAAAQGESPWAKLLISVLILAAVGGGSFILFKRFAKPIANSSMQIKVLTQHHLGPRKSLAIVRVAGESVLIGITDHNISMIKSLSLLDEDIPEVNENNFSESLKKVGQAQKEKVDDEFSMQGIRDMVSQKLRNMRNLE